MSSAEYADSKAVMAANRAFYRAFEALDAQAMGRVWWDDPSVRCVHPGGEMLVGHTLVMASWEAIFESTSEISFELADLAVDMHGDVAWVSLVERMDGPEEEGGQAEAATTNAFLRQEDGSWLMCLHHASPIMRRFTR